MKIIELKHKNLNFFLEVIKANRNLEGKFQSVSIIRFCFIDINKATEDLTRKSRFSHVYFETIESTRVGSRSASYKHFKNKYKIQFFESVLNYLNEAKNDIDKQIDDYLEENFFDDDI